MDARRILAMVIVLGSLANASSALAACGDGVLDRGEQCDHAAANGHDDCCSAICQLIDADGDGTCDAIDPCDDNTGILIKEATLAITGLSTEQGDDSFGFSGTMTVPNPMTVPSAPPIDPSATGVRLRMFAPYADPHGTEVADVSIPGGSQWTRRPNGSAWMYRDPAGRVGGITRVDVKLLPPLVPTTHLTKVVFAVTGRRGSFPVTPAMVTSESTLQVTLALGAPGAASNRQCGSVYYTTVRPTHCEFGVSGNRMTCSGPPPVGPCRIGDPDDLMVCDIVNAAHAEDRYFAAHGTYYGGACTGLPGFVPSPGVTCSVSGSSIHFVVTTSHPSALRASCTWTATVAAGGDLVCD